MVFTDIVGGLFSQQGIGVRGLFQNGDHGVQGKGPGLPGRGSPGAKTTVISSAGTAWASKASRKTG